MNRFQVLQTWSLIAALFGAGTIASFADEKGIADFPRLSVERDWPWWRGPSRNGRASQTPVPTTFSDTENLVWKVPVPGRGHSSPIIVGDRVFLTTANPKEKIHSVLAFDRETGKLLWQKDVNNDGFPAKNHPKNTEATPTVASDGQRLFATFYHHDKVVAVCLDFDGTELWTKDVCRFRPTTYEYGYAPSRAVIYKDLPSSSLAEYDGPSSITALDRATGKQVWQSPRQSMITFSTVTVAHIAGKDQMLISGAQKVNSYDPADGKPRWSAEGTTFATCGTMVWDGDIVFSQWRLSEERDDRGESGWKRDRSVAEQSKMLRAIDADF